jgi:hypothetical protein
MVGQIYTLFSEFILRGVNLLVAIRKICYVLQKSDSVWKTGLSLQTYSKPGRNELKTWFSLDVVNEGLDKICKPGLKRPKTWDKPTLNLPKNQVLLSFVSSRVDKPGLRKFIKVDKPGLKLSNQV